MPLNRYDTPLLRFFVPVPIRQSNTPQASSAENSGSSDSSGSGSDSDGSSEDEVAASKKRKADSEVVPAAKKSKTTTGGEDGGQKNLFVGQLSWNVDEDWLTREFERFGELSSVRVISDKNTGRSKGFAHSFDSNPLVNRLT